MLYSYSTTPKIIIRLNELKRISSLEDLHEDVYEEDMLDPLAEEFVPYFFFCRLFIINYLITRGEDILIHTVRPVDDRTLLCY